jgi:hypothetical protein
MQINHIIEYLARAQWELDTIYAYCHQKQQSATQTYSQYLRGEATLEATQKAWRIATHALILTCSLEIAVYQNLCIYLEGTHAFDE